MGRGGKNESGLEVDLQQNWISMGDLFCMWSHMVSYFSQINFFLWLHSYSPVHRTANTADISRWSPHDVRDTLLVVVFFLFFFDRAMLLVVDTQETTSSSTDVILRKWCFLLIYFFNIISYDLNISSCDISLILFLLYINHKCYKKDKI